MEQQALGLIEIIGMVGAVEAADTCLKSANVRLAGFEQSTGGLVTVKIQGDVGAVKSAIDSARVSASRMSEVVAAAMIPRPAQGIRLMIHQENSGQAEEKGRAETAFEEKGEAAGEQEAGSFPEIPREMPQEMKAEAETIADRDGENRPESQEPPREETEVSCNLCEDPQCSRQKGQPRNLCIHYGEES